MTELLDTAIATDVRLTSEWLCVDSNEQETGLGGDRSDKAMQALCENLTDIIKTVEKGGHLVERLEYRNILSMEYNPKGHRGFVRVLFTRKKRDANG